MTGKGFGMTEGFIDESFLVVAIIGVLVIYPDKVRLNCYYYRHYSFVKDIQMIFCTVLGRNMKYAGEEI